MGMIKDGVLIRDIKAMRKLAEQITSKETEFPNFNMEFVEGEDDA
jgi:hypothetical protein